MPTPPQPSFSPQPNRSGWLLRRYAKNRDPRDLDALVQRFRPLARRLALRYARGGEALDDLEQVANLGLVKALQRFEPDQGFAFTSFAVPTILGELRRSFRDSAWAAHVPRSVQERSARVRETVAALESEHGQAPSVREIATWLGISEEDVLDALAAHDALSSLSLDAPASGGDDSPSIADQLGLDDAGYERVEDLAAVHAALPALTDVQRLVVGLRFSEDLKQSEIARRIGVSQMQVSRLLSSAIERLGTVAAQQSRPPQLTAA